MRPPSFGRRGSALFAATTAATTAATLVAVLGAAPATGSPAAADASGERPTSDTAAVAPLAPDTPALADGTTTVTLVTGDVVHVSVTGDGALVLDVPPAAGGRGTFIETVGGDAYVIPDAAQPYLASGALDRRLFNVTELLESGYDDETSDGIPVIAQRSRAARAATTLPGAEVATSLPSIGAEALVVTADGSDEFWSAVTQTSATSRAAVTAPGRLAGGVTKLWLDGKAEAALDVTVPEVRAPEAWAAGLDGTGSTVAVLDTGVDATHPDLAGRIADTVSFVPGEEVTDGHGHGTHVASTVAGTGAASGGANTGVAPGATLKVGKVLDDSGYGQDSWIIAGMEWAASEADVVSMSLGDSSLTDGKDPISQALNALSEQTGALFVVAAGNSYGSGTVSAPGAADAALTVGATDGAYRASFSSYGPRTGDGAIKPDMSAPGVDVTAARSSFSAGTGDYTSMSGTSMATPHVAGAAAIVLQAHPDWSGEQVRDALVSSASRTAATTYEVGTGKLDVVAAVDGVDVSGSGFFGFVAYGSELTGPVERTLTYTNASAADVTLALASSVTAPGAAEPSSTLVRLSATEVTVPAGGSVDVNATLDPADAPDAGEYQGAVTGTVVGGDLDGVEVRTAVGLVREAEMYDLTVTATDRSGLPIGGQLILYRQGDWSASALEIPESGELTRRLVPGTYVAVSYLDVAGSEPGTAGVALVGDPELEIDGSDVHLVLDASAANEVTLTTPRESDVEYRRMHFSTGGGWLGFSAAYVPSPEIASIYVAPQTTESDAFGFGLRWHATEPLLDLSAYTPSKGDSIEPRYQYRSARLDGHVDLEVVDAGDGTAAELAAAGVAGKAVLVQRGAPWNVAQQAADAAAAGAAFLMVVDDQPFLEYAGGTDLPVVSLTAADAARLVPTDKPGNDKPGRDKPVRIKGAAIEVARYTYDVSTDHTEGFPEDVAVAPTTAELATVQASYHDEQARTASASRADCHAWQWPLCIAYYTSLPTQSEQTQYVSTYPGVTWFEQADHQDDWNQRGPGPVAYEPGSVTERHWFAPVANPVLGDGYWAPRQSGTWFALNVAPAGGPDGITGARVWGSARSKLYQGDTLLRSSIDQAVQTTVPSAPGLRPYRFVLDSTPTAFGYATTVHGEWTFLADTAAYDETDGWIGLPFLSPAIDVDTALDGTVPAGVAVPVGVTPYHLPGASDTGTIDSATLEVSFDDGATWAPVELTRDGGTWSGAITPTAAGFVSLRVTAADDAGNTVLQEITRAFGVK